jgi:hypothetical protein
MVPNTLPTWEKAIRAISEDMPALVRLTVTLGHRIRLYPYCCPSLAEPAQPSTGCESQLFDLLRMIKTPEHFDVLTNWPVTKELMEDAPFSLVETTWENEPEEEDEWGRAPYHSNLLQHNYHKNPYLPRGQKPPDVWIIVGAGG